MFNWDDKYLLGNIFIDSEHQILYKLAQKICGEKGTLSHDEIIHYLKAIMEYTSFHFEHEEKIMRELGWDGYDHHREVHAIIIKEMKETILNNKNIVKLQVKLSLLLTKWIVEHIEIEDQKYKNDLVKKYGFITLD